MIFLHGGLANTDYWGNQVTAVAAHHTVILMDSRGHGRSTRDARPYGYDLMADDVVGAAGYAAISRRPTSSAGATAASSGSTSRCATGPGRQGVRLRRQHRDLGRGQRASRRTRPSPRYIERAGHEYAGCRRRLRNTTPSSPDQQDVGGPAQLDRRSTQAIKAPVLGRGRRP